MYIRRGQGVPVFIQVVQDDCPRLGAVTVKIVPPRQREVLERFLSGHWVNTDVASQRCAAQLPGGDADAMVELRGIGERDEATGVACSHAEGGDVRRTYSLMLHGDDVRESLEVLQFGRARHTGPTTVEASLWTVLGVSLANTCPSIGVRVAVVCDGESTQVTGIARRCSYRATAGGTVTEVFGKGGGLSGELTRKAAINITRTIREAALGCVYIACLHPNDVIIDDLGAVRLAPLLATRMRNHDVAATAAVSMLFTLFANMTRALGADATIAIGRHALHVAANPPSWLPRLLTDAARGAATAARLGVCPEPIVQCAIADAASGTALGALESLVCEVGRTPARSKNMDAGVTYPKRTRSE